MLTDNWVFWNRYPKFDAFDVYYKALEAAFNALGNAHAKSVWKGFKGDKILQDNKDVGKEKFTYKLVLNSNGVNLDDKSTNNFEPVKGNLVKAIKNKIINYIKQVGNFATDTKQIDP